LEYFILSYWLGGWLGIARDVHMWLKVCDSSVWCIMKPPSLQIDVTISETKIAYRDYMNSHQPTAKQGW
jgi:hypothetical protein